MDAAVNRRWFLGGALGTIAAPAILEALEPTRRIFLPPAGGWPLIYWNVGDFSNQAPPPRTAEQMLADMNKTLQSFRENNAWAHPDRLIVSPDVARMIQNEAARCGISLDEACRRLI